MVSLYEKSNNATVSLVENSSNVGEGFKRKDDLSVDTMCLMWDSDGHIEYISREAENYIQLDLSDHQEGNLMWTSIFNQHFIDNVKKHFTTNVETLQLCGVIFQNVTSLTHPFDAEVTQISLKGELFYIGYFKNKTLLDSLYDYLEESEKQLNTSWLAAGFVHEIRNPLTSLKGFLQLLQAGVTQKEEYYRVMISEVEKLEDLTDELLSLAKQKEQNKQKESVQHLVGDVVFLMETQSHLRNIDFQVDVDNHLFIYCKASRIKQVLINVMKNSAEAMSYKGTIEITAYEEEGNVFINIIDQGKGMEVVQLKEAKTPFYTTKESGTGLGLVIMKHILKSHGGGYSFHQNDYKGLTVKIQLPAM